MGHQKVTLQEVAKLSWGNTSITKSSYIKEGFPAFSAKGNDGFLDHAEFNIDGIVLSAIGARCGKCFKARGKWTAIKNTITIIPDQNKVDLDYLFIQLNNKKFWKISGAAQTFITLSTVKERLVSLPPLVEQKRIAALLQAADNIIITREQIIYKLDEIAQSIFINMFGDPIRNNKKWQLNSLGDVLDLITYGLTVRPKYVLTGVPIISAKEIRNGYIDIEKALKISETDYNKVSEKGKPVLDDILFSKTGSIGYCALVRTNEKFVITQNAARLNFKETLVNVIFALYYLKSGSIQTLAKKTAHGNAIKDLQLSAMKKFPFPLPPLSLQKKFAKKINIIEQLKVKNTLALTKHNQIFDSLKNQSFSMN